MFRVIVEFSLPLVRRTTDARRPQQCERDDTNPVGTPIGIGPRGQHDGIKYIITNVLVAPVQVVYVALGHRCRQRDLDCNGFPIPTDRNEITLMVTTPGAHMADARFGCVCEHSDTLRHQ